MWLRSAVVATVIWCMPSLMLPLPMKPTAPVAATIATPVAPNANNLFPIVQFISENSPFL
jgi:hypothetical protein